MLRRLVALLAVLCSSAQAVGNPGVSPIDEVLASIARGQGEPRVPLEAAGQPDRPARGPEPGGLLLFVSRGMPRAELAAALAQAGADPAVTLVVRGLMPGETFADTLRTWSRLLAREQSHPTLVIDPTLYRRYRVTSVPTLIDVATGAIARASRTAPRPGTTHEPARTSFLDAAAGSYPIAEQDLAEVLIARAASLDLPTRAKTALARFWRQAPAVTLPPATTTRTRRHRPFVRTSNDLRDHNGKLLLPAGSRLNPLQTLPLTARILVLDAQDPHEIAWARTQRHPSRATIHLLTTPDREAGWGAWQVLQRQLAAPPFLLDRHLADRLGVHATPSLIEAEGTELVVREIALPRAAAEAAR